MGVLSLSRIHFGVSAGFHYLFPLAVLGLMLFVVIFEAFYFFRKDEQYRVISSFFIKLLGFLFAMGVATAIMLPFAFGMNWYGFTVFAGSVFGVPLAIGAVTVFALGSSLLLILLYGRSKVSPFIYRLVIILVFVSFYVSAFFIVAAVSWMHTPAGFTVENGRAVLTNLYRVIFNPSAVIRFVHVIIASWITGAFLTAAIGAYYLLSGKESEASKKILRISIPAIVITVFLQIMSGRVHIQEVREYNPVRYAAYEGIFKTVKAAPFYLFGMPDEKKGRIRSSVGIPRGLLESGNPKSRVKGLEEYPRSSWPPVSAVFTVFHMMILLGILMLAVGIAGCVLMTIKKLDSSKWFLGILMWMFPAPFLANELGWIGAELGRQPWIVYGYLKTADAFSAQLPLWQPGLMLVFICLVIIFLIVLTFSVVMRLLQNGIGAK